MGVNVEHLGMDQGLTKPGHEQIASSASYEARGYSSLRLIATRRRNVDAALDAFDLEDMRSHLSKRHAREVRLVLPNSIAVLVC
jgi:hypothetical protein